MKQAVMSQINTQFFMDFICHECLVRQLDTVHLNSKHAMQEVYHRFQKRSINQPLKQVSSHADATRQIFKVHGIYISHTPPFTILPAHFQLPGSADVEPASRSPAQSFCPSPC